MWTVSLLQPPVPAWVSDLVPSMSMLRLTADALLYFRPCHTALKHIHIKVHSNGDAECRWRIREFFSKSFAVTVGQQPLQERQAAAVQARQQGPPLLEFTLPVASAAMQNDLEPDAGIPSLRSQGDAVAIASQPVQLNVGEP